MTPRFPANDRVALSLDEAGVAHVRMIRADKLNALDDAMIDALIAAGEALHGLPALRCVVLSGEGRAFCAGLDLSVMGGSLASGTIDLVTRSHGHANRFQQVAVQWRKLPVPVIAAIQGVCFGGGLQIAAGADLRFATSDARLAVMEMKWGIVPDMGAVCPAARHGARRCPARADLYRARAVGQRSPGARPRHPAGGRSAGRRP